MFVGSASKARFWSGFTQRPRQAAQSDEAPKRPRDTNCVEH